VHVTDYLQIAGIPTLVSIPRCLYC